MLSKIPTSNLTLDTYGRIRSCRLRGKRACANLVHLEGQFKDRIDSIRQFIQWSALLIQYSTSVSPNVGPTSVEDSEEDALQVPDLVSG